MLVMNVTVNGLCCWQQGKQQKQPALETSKSSLPGDT
jgi:hypothetical protein